jgi:hypothetical protein
MRPIRAAAIVIGLLTTLPAFCLAGTSQADGMTRSLDAVHATKGVVKFVDANKVVITRSRQYGRELTFVLNPSTERVGNVQVGSTVDIRYRTEAKQQVATAVTVVRAKQPRSSPGSPVNKE